MHNRFILPQVIFMTIVVLAIIAIPTLTLADARDHFKTKSGHQEQSLMKNDQEASSLKKPLRYQRSTYMWPYASGPYYGDAPANLMHSPHWLKTMVGIFDTRNPIDQIPVELRKDLSPLTQIGMQYFIVQFHPDAFDNGKFQDLRREFESMGVLFFDYLPNRAYIVLLNSANYPMVSSSSAVKFIEPYHPAFKISPQIGRIPLTDPAKAVSPIYSLNVMVFPNESATLVAQQISKMGGLIKSVVGDTINVDIDRSQLGNIASIEAVRAIYEDIPVILWGEETTSTMQVGNNIGPNMAIPYFDVGIDGSGGGLASVQKLQVIDSGASYDAKDLSDTETESGTPGPSHRKVYAYVNVGTLGTGGSGDLQTCDDLTSGGYTHGHVVSATALGNATDVPPSYGNPTWFEDDVGNQWKIDGVAKGALLLMYDCYATPTFGPCDEGCNPGDLYNSANSNSTLLHGYNNGARAANASWGGGGNVYGTQAQDIDTFLIDKRDAMVFISAGNEGGDDDNNNIPDEWTVGSPATAKNAISVGMSYNSNTSSVYNPETRVFMSSVGPVGSTSRPRVKPDLMAPGDDPYGAGSNMGIDSEYSCKSHDNDNTGTPICEISQGSGGTSFSSPAAMGAYALVRDYFAQGFYPDGTSSNSNNDSDKIANVSGALVKAILMASADFMTGSNLSKEYRFNYEQGYGRIQLSNALPLVTDPSTPTGLIIDDQGLDTGSGISPGVTIQDSFEVTDVNEPLRIVVAWIDEVGEDLINDLDLTVVYDADGDGTADATEPTWWGNFFTEDWLIDDPETGGVDLVRDGKLDGDMDGTEDDMEDNDGDGVLDSSEWSLRVIDSSKVQRDFLNPNEGVFISPEDLQDENNDGTADDPMTGQWIWKIYAHSDNTQSQRYALAIAGGVVLGSSIRFDKSPVLCQDIVHVIVNEIDEAGDSSLDESIISSRTTVYVIDPGPDGELDGTNDTTVDTETGLTFHQQGAALKFVSQDLPVTDADFANRSDNDGILHIQNGYFLKAVYQDYLNGSPSTQRFSIIGSDCTTKLNKGIRFIQYGRDYAFLIDGGCEVNDLDRSSPDKYMDVDEKLIYWIAIWNGDIDLIDVEVTLEALVPGTSTPSPYVNILEPTKNVGNLNADAGMGIPFELEIVGSPTFPTQVDMKLGLKAKKSGKTVEEYQTFTHVINADDEVFHYSTDFPTGGIVTRDYNNDEEVEDISGTGKDKGGQLDAPGEDWDFWYETIKFDDMTTTAFGGGNPGFDGPWDFDSDDEGFRSGIQPDSTQGAGNVIANWGEDMNWDGSLQAEEDRDPQNGQLDQNWAIQNATYMQCGYQTKAPGSPGYAGGIWHTGTTYSNPKSKTPCAGSGSGYRCQFYETRVGTTGRDFWFEILRSPEVHKVHLNPDANGFDYYSEFHYMTLQWNQQVDLVDDYVLVTYEVDTDTSTEVGVKIDDFTVLNLFAGAMTIRNGGDGNQNLLDGFSVFAPSDSSGNETNGTVGNNRVGSRGCYFQADDGVDPNSPHGLAKPPDDDIDNNNDGTVDEYVTNNGPIRNMDTNKNNGLPQYYTLEDLYGDAGTDYEVAFGFYVAEGQDETALAGYGLAIDDVVLEWDEIHPIEDATDCATNGQCASLSIKTIDMYEGNALVPVSVIDFNAATTQATDSDSDGLMEVKVEARSEAEPEGETFILEQTSSGSFEYSGIIPVSASYNTEGTIFLKREGTNLPTLIVKYVDKDDGVHTWSQGADNKPGEAGVDDDGDGTLDEEDEFCPLGAGDIYRPYGDDSCGCPNNPLEMGSSVTYPVGRLSIEAVTIVDDNGDHDGFADACETVTLDITLKNLARAAGEFIPLTDVSATIDNVIDADNDGTPDNTVACILDPSASYGDMDVLASKTNASTDRFQFQVDCNIDRTNVYEDLNAVFDLNISANEIEGLYQPLRFSLPLDLDATGGGTELSSDLFEDFESCEPNIDNSDWTNCKLYPVRVAHHDGVRCQYNDPDNPDGNSYNRPNCEIDNVSALVEDQDWHIHDTASPDAGRAYLGQKSMHWGYHANPNDAGYDTAHFQEMNLAVVKAGNRINLGLGTPILSFKHQLNLLDSRWSNTPAGEAADRAIVMVAKTDNNGSVQGNWIKIFPYDNVYNVQGTDQFINCTFDPTDDGSTEDDFFPNSHYWGPSSTCFPEFVWSWMGDTDFEAVYDPEAVGAGNGPGLEGSLGPGTWVESKFNLHQFRGYQIRFRFLVTTIEVFPAQTYQDAGWPTNMDGDDGWYVDDIRITNMLDAPVTLSDDQSTNPSNQCPTTSSDKCDTVTALLDCVPDGIDNDQDGTIDPSIDGIDNDGDGSIDEDDEYENNCQTLAPGHSFTLTAAGSYPNKCVDGSLNYRFWLDVDQDGTIDGSDTLLYDWSDKAIYVDNPVSQQQYCVEVRCATDTACLNHTCIAAGPAAAVIGKVYNLLYLSNQKVTFEWDVAVGASTYDTVKGDLDQLRSTSGDFSSTITSCLENDGTDTQSTDTEEPVGDGQGFYYLVRATGSAGIGSYDTDANEGRDAGINSSPNACP